MNKSKQILAVAFASILAFGTVSCDKDDETTENTNPAVQAVSGTYNGTIIESIGGENRDTVNGTIVITPYGENAVSVTLPSFGEGAMALMKCVVENVTVTANENAYTVSKENFEKTLTKADGSTIVYTGSIDGTVSNGCLTLSYDIKPGAMPMSIHFSFSQQ